MCGLVSQPVWSTQHQSDSILDLSLEQLGNIEVTSISKKSERLADAAAAIYVITNDEIRRAGVFTLPEALRLAPNLQVARISAFDYAISARGFNGGNANKLLVMIDGRTIYSPLHSLVFWDAQDVMLEDVERIEVISGPAGTVWGINAVNGVINIITKSANDTKGNLAQLQAGQSGDSFSARHGGVLEAGGYRLYAKAFGIPNSVRGGGAVYDDTWRHWQGGFRTDLLRDATQMTIQGDIYRDVIKREMADHARNQGGNLQARWQRKFDSGATLHIQGYYDYTKRYTPGVYAQRLNMADVDVQYAFSADQDKQWIVGGGYRVADDKVVNSALLAFMPAQRTLQWANLFVQHERPVAQDVRLIAGTKAEYNSYTHIEWLPNLKLAWRATPKSLLWTSVSRAVRAPSRVEVDFYVPGQPPFVLLGGPNFRSEVANTLDFGWRFQGHRIGLTAVAFTGNYKRLRSADLQPGGRTIEWGNALHGRVSGLEGWATYEVRENLSVDVSGVWLRERFSGVDVSQMPPGNDPRTQWKLGATWRLDDSKSLTVKVRHVGALPAPHVPSYTTLDAHLGWRLSPTVELGLSGRNLTDPRHPEFLSRATPDTSVIQVKRAVDLVVTVRF
ncbi:TonB-dependent receptor [Chitinivorax sp. B]|uniref:TonB-dependent receptor plug domain-containing protein n=1 Tax=Chitinivorax sp. B TaxID=2502235 RepID=UPI001484F86C|nr:TonB-dependent receptor [Chitinivorax sp. B]